MRKRKDESEKLGVFLWCERVRMQLGLKREPPHQVEMEINRRLSNRLRRPNGRWLKHEKDGCVPRRPWGLAIESIAPGSWPIVDNCLWASLRADFDAEKQANKLLKGLSAKIRSLVFDPATDQRRKITHGLLDRLQRRLPETERLDILACLVIFLREAHAQEESAIATLVGNHIQHAVLALLGAEIFGSISSRLFEIFYERIFPLSGKKSTVVWQPSLFLDAVEYIQTVLLQFEEKEKIKLSEGEKISFISNFIWRHIGTLGPESIFLKLKRPTASFIS